MWIPNIVKTWFVCFCCGLCLVNLLRTPLYFLDNYATLSFTSPCIVNYDVPMISALGSQLHYCLCPHEGCSLIHGAKFRPLCLLLFHMKIIKIQSIYLSIDRSIDRSIDLSICLSIVCLSVWLFLSLSVCVHVLVFSFMLHCYSVLKRVKTPLNSSPWQSHPHWKQHKATSMSHKMLRHESGQWRPTKPFAPVQGWSLPETWALYFCFFGFLS